MEISEEKTQPSLRNLGFEVSAERYFDIVSFDVCGQTVAIKYYVKVTREKVINKIVISSGLGTFEFGNKGCTGNFGKTWEYKQPIFTFRFPGFPLVSVGAYAEGEIYTGVSLKYFQGTTVSACLKGKLVLGAEIKAGWDVIASLSAGAEGTVVEADTCVIIKEGSVSEDRRFTLKMGGLVAYIKGCLFTNDIEVKKFTIFEGWSYVKSDKRI